MRTQPIVSFSERVTGDLRSIVDRLQSVLGKVVSLADVALLLNVGGYTVTNAAAGAGTALTATRVPLDLADAGVDQVRLVVRGKNSAAGTVTLQAYDVTGSAALCTVAVVDGTEATFTGAWTNVTPSGIDQEVEVRVVGDGVFDPVIYAVHLQLRTLQARS